MNGVKIRVQYDFYYFLGPTLMGVGEFTDPRDHSYFPTYIDYFQKKANKRALLVAELTKKYVDEGSVVVVVSQTVRMVSQQKWQN